MVVEISLQGKAKKHPKIQTIQTTIQQSLETLYRALDLRDPELSVVLTDDVHILELNTTWRGEEEATDVLSFPLYEADEITPDIPALGDIVISLEYADRLVDSQEHRRRVAGELGVEPDSLRWTLVEEVTFLLIHGLLHLVGLDHGDEDEEAHMKSEERRLWESLEF